MSNKDTKSIKFEEEINDLTNRLKRALADYQNLEKRVLEDKADFVKFANGNLLLKILPGLDSLEKARMHLKDEGLVLAIKQIETALGSEGLEKIETKDQSFNPETMECLEVAEGEDGQVLEEIRSGYKLNGRVLRVAQVKVGKKLN